MRLEQASHVTLGAALVSTALLDSVLLLNGHHLFGAQAGSPLQLGPSLSWGILAIHAGVAGAAMPVLHRLHRRAKAARLALASQAESLGRMRFVEQQQPPATEYQDLAKSLNVAAVRLREQFQEREAHLGELRDHVDTDPVTGLGSRVYFDGVFQAYLAASGAFSGGALALLKVDDLLGVNARLGRERTDELLRAVAAQLRLRLPPLGDKAAIARVSGSEFAVLAPDVGAKEFGQWLAHLTRGLGSLCVDGLTDRPQVAWVGATTYACGESAEPVVNRASAMVQASELARAPWKLTTGASPLNALGVAEWRMVLESALDTGRVQIRFSDMARPDMTLLHRQATVTLKLPDGRELSGHEVISPAIQIGRQVNIDLRVITLALDSIIADGLPVAVKLSTQSVSRPIFLKQLAEVLGTAGPAAGMLTVEVQESALLEGQQALQPLAAVLALHGVKLGLDCSSDRPTDLQGLAALAAVGSLQGVDVRYLKLDAERLRQWQSCDSGRRWFDMCRTVCAAQRWQILAAGVESESDLTMVRQLRLDACMGQAAVPRRQQSPLADAAARAHLEQTA